MVPTSASPTFMFWNPVNSHPGTDNIFFTIYICAEHKLDSVACAVGLSVNLLPN
jgi:hypothetical protein